MNRAPEHVGIKVEDLPELETEVSISGSCKQQEVGGIVCMGIAAGVAIYVAN
ncbi:hypothetical protein [Sphingosinicella sp. CPCC 101087]|uniref:hypothetical protein n=1 Tax=Sphingosinicella sp. CPCC 101087 TaxID=2497754 RepID=UPI0013EC7468|nr:hypothetical protein [Sphingosinicella sp. CPCC 101087]